MTHTCSNTLVYQMFILQCTYSLMSAVLLMYRVYSELLYYVYILRDIFVCLFDLALCISYFFLQVALSVFFFVRL